MSQIVQATRKCVGRDGSCFRDAVRGWFCNPCWEALPRCANCGHHVDAHDEGPCAVNAHETATGPACECAGFVSAEELEDGGL